MKSDFYEIYDIDYKVAIKGVSSIMYNGHILKKDEKFQVFFEKAKMNIDDTFIIDSNGYEDIKYCNDKEIRLYLSSSVIYERKGNGHLYVKGKWKMEETNPIKAISLSYHIE